jgi:hypothetical protein
LFNKPTKFLISQSTQKCQRTVKHISVNYIMCVLIKFRIGPTPVWDSISVD